MTIAEFWKERYEVVVAEKKALGEKLGETLDENKELKEQLDKLKNRLTYTALKDMEMEIARLKESLEGSNKFSDILQEKLDAANAEKKDLQQQINGLRRSNETIKRINSRIFQRLASSTYQTQELKMQLKQKEEENESLHNVIDSFVDKCKELEDKADGYKKERDEKIELLNAVQDRFTKADLEAQVKDLTARYENTSLSKRIYKERLEKSIADRKELQADRDFWVHDSAEKTVEIQSLKSKVESLEADLKSETCSRDTWRTEAERLRKEITESYSDGYSDGNEEGQNELWEMLQLINDVKPFEAPYFEDVTSMNDIISWDLEDFKEAYDKWEAEKKKAAEEAKKKHVDYMRDYLKRYCIGKLCFNCPLYNASKPVSSCLFSKLTDEEVEKRYRTAVDSEYKKTRVPVSARLPQPWECTIEAKVEINEAVLNTICGTIKDDKEEES